MKKKMFKLFAGVSIFASLLAVNVQALGVEEGNNSASESVTVGSVETPVYSVEIGWGEFEYDWVYDSSTGEYKWQPSEVERCLQAVRSNQTGGTAYTFPYDENGYLSAMNKGNIYSDSSCSTPTTSVAYNDIATTPVYSKVTTPGSAVISITDTSTAGRIVPSINWQPNSGYNWVTGKFNYVECSSVCIAINSEESFNDEQQIYTDDKCSAGVDKSAVSYQAGQYYALNQGCVINSIDGGVIPEAARSGMGVSGDGTVGYGYNLDFEIGVDSSKTVTTPKAGDAIGTITVSIAAKE